MTPASVISAVTSPFRTLASPVTSMFSGAASSSATPTGAAIPSNMAAASDTTGSSGSSSTPPSSSGSGAAASSSSSGTSTQNNIMGAQSSLNDDQQMFLKLLTAQLKNQDPLSPLDANQFTQQLVVMTGVQQQILTNQLLQQMATRQSGIGDPVSLIGKTVTANTPAAALNNGQASWNYSLDGDAQNVSIQVIDSMGRVVAQNDPGATGSGEHSFTWDGKDLGGVQRPDGGVYALRITATDATGAAVSGSVYQRGTALSVEQGADGSMININGLKVPLSAITIVGAPA